VRVGASTSFTESSAILRFFRELLRPLSPAVALPQEVP